MSKVLAVKPDNFKGSDGNEVICFKVELDDRTQPVPCYDSRAADLKVNEALPEGWEVRKSKKDKDYLSPPKKAGGFGGGQSSWYNSEVGVRFTQERTDRRTALMQAVEAKRIVEHIIDVEGLLVVAADFYAWLRKTSQPAAPAPAQGAPSPEPEGAAEPAETSLDGARHRHGAGSGSNPTPPPVSAERPEPGYGEGPGSGESSPAPDTALAVSGTKAGDDRTSAPVAGDIVEGAGTAPAASSPSPLDQLYDKFGNGNKALLAARKFYADSDPPLALADLSPSRIAELLERV